DNLLSAERFSVPLASRVDFVEGSIAHDSVLRQLPGNLDFVFHLATYHGKQNSRSNPLADHENNTLATIKLYDYLKNSRPLKKVVYASTACPEDDSVSLWLDTPNRISKVIGELYSNYYFDHHHLPIVKARFQSVYGPGEILGAGRWRGTSAT